MTIAAAPPQAASAAAESLFSVEGLRCAGCIAKLETGLGATPGVIAARVNFSAKRLRVAHLPELDEAALLTAIDALGFAAHPFAAPPVQAPGEARRLALALGVAGFAAMNVMLLSVSIWSGADGATRQLFHWLSALIALPAIAYAGRPFFESAARALRRGRTNMDVPISIGVALTAATSLYETASGGAHAYFDGAVMLLFFLLAGRLLDSVARARAEDGVAALLRRVPREATVMQGGIAERRDAAELAPGMRLLVAAGERIAADGVVEAGESSIDRALVTGESLPEAARPGTRVLAGTINLAAPLTIRVTAVGEGCAIAEIARLMEAAGQSRSAYVRVADRAARWYAPAVHSLAAASFVGWLIAGASLHQAVTIAVAVLIITCPCALGLAVPVAQVVASGALLRAGVLVKDGSALERLARASRVVLDKTGTVTLGRLRVTAGLPEEAAARAVLAALAGASRHPLARAVSVALEGVAPAAITGLVEHPGLGIEGICQGERARLGRPDWVLGGAASAEHRAAFAWGTINAAIEVADPPRADAAAAIAELAALGLDPVLFSGDSPPGVAQVAGPLGITAAARMSPADKAARIAALQAAGARVLMVGDGLNDGPALKAASVAMAPAEATDVGQQAADALFFGDQLRAVPRAVRAARATMAVVRQNFALAIGYNLLAVPLAIAGQVTPLIAALAMSGSSLLVVGNALRLRGAAR